MKTFSLSEAKRKLGRVADQALQGEPILIIRKSRLLLLREFHPLEAVPLRPAGYFKDLYTDRDARKSNRLAGQSRQRPVR